MSKKKKPVEAFDTEGPAAGSLQEGYTWCPECQASFQGEVCPGCSVGVSPGITAFTGLETERPKSTTLAEVAEQVSIETNTITEILPVPITDAEYKEIGLKMGAANQEIIQAENELKSVKSQYKSRIDSAKTRRDECASIINAGHQQRQVECHLMKDFNENTITLVRLDTGEVVRTRTMTTAERQRGLEFEE